MTRILMSGWESGDRGQIGVAVASVGNLPEVVTNTPTPRSGTYCLKATTQTGSAAASYSAVNVTHPVLTELYFAFGLYFSPADIPAGNRSLYLLTYEPITGNLATGLGFEIDGSLRAYYLLSGSWTLIGTASMVAPLNTWVHLEIRLVASITTTGTVQMRLNSQEVMNLTNVRTCQTAAQFGGFRLGQYRVATGGNTAYFAYDDLRVNTTTGTVNNSWPGDTSIRALSPDSPGTTIGGTPLTSNGWTLKSLGAAPSVVDTSAGAAFNITDADELTYWRSTRNVNEFGGVPSVLPWFYIDLGTAQQIDAYSIYQSTVLTSSFATSFRIDSSDDATTWVQRHLALGQLALPAERFPTRLTTPASARYWRFIIQTSSGTGDWVIHNASLYALDASIPNWQNVRPPAIGSDYNYGSLVGTGETYGMSALGPSGAIGAVNIVTQAYNSDGAGGVMGITVKTPAGTSEGPPVFLGSSPAIYNRILENDPSDAAAWTAGKIDALEAGITVR